MSRRRTLSLCIWKGYSQATEPAATGRKQLPSAKYLDDLMFLSITQREQTPQELVTELVLECSESEQLRLLAWANMERYDLATAKPLRKKGDGTGPDDSNERVVTNAVAAGRL